MTNKILNFRTIPKMDAVIASEKLNKTGIRPELVKKVIEQEISDIRKQLKDERIDTSPSADDIALHVLDKLETLMNSGIRPMINATGVMVYTNMGRAPLAKSCINAIRDSSGYSNLEYSIEEGVRGSRQDHIKAITRFVFGTEDAIAVNNNAAAVMLVLASLAAGREVIVSRGELVEIGGSFRMPDVMTLSGAILKEVGTTNKTRISDYEKAINEKTGLIMKVHRSNFALVGFTDEASIKELSALSRSKGIPFYIDMGSGIPFDLSGFGINGEWSIASCLEENPDILSFSGDKVISGPQAGIIIGKKEYISKMSKHPLHRALRIDKFCLSALIETLKIIGLGEYDKLPVLKMITEDISDVKKRAARLKRMIKASCSIEKTRAVIGGGSAPSSSVASYAVRLKVGDAVKAHARLRAKGTVCRIEDDFLLFDLKTVFSDEIKTLASRINHAIETAN